MSLVLKLRRIVLSDQNVKRAYKHFMWSSELYTDAVQDLKNRKAKISRHHSHLSNLCACSWSLWPSAIQSSRAAGLVSPVPSSDVLVPDRVPPAPR